jgi:hypothetical protein
MHTDEPPRAVLTHENVGGSELTVVGLATVRRFLIMNSDHNGTIAEETHLGIAPIQPGGNKIAIPIAI